MTNQTTASATRKFFRVIGLLLSLGWTAQYFYWAARMLAWSAGWSEWPQISGDWQFLACVSAGSYGIYHIERRWNGVIA